jgi:hypothetical protein
MTSESKDGAPRHRTNFETPEISQMAANYSAEIGRDVSGGSVGFRKFRV